MVNLVHPTKGKQHSVFITNEEETRTKINAHVYLITFPSLTPLVSVSHTKTNIYINALPSAYIEYIWPLLFPNLK